ncbi:MAG: YbjQ family protein [Bacteroidales bacterium]|nr:YbjQ family protein [Bacteroidales bacterium]
MTSLIYEAREHAIGLIRDEAAAIGADDWASMRGELHDRLVAVGLHPPKPVKDIAVPAGQRIFDLMPMHPDIKQQDSLIVRNHLRTSLLTLHAEFARDFDLAALAAELAPRGA